MRQAERAVRGGAQSRLSVRPMGCAGRGVARMPNSVFARHGAERGLIKNLGHQPHVFIHVDALAVARCDTGGFLPAMLQCIQAVVG